MPTFAYTARDRAGQMKRGVATGLTAAQVREQLRQGDLFLTNIREQAADSESMVAGSLFRARRVRLNDMVIMSRQLATLIGAGMPLVESLFTLSAQTENPKLLETLNSVRVDVLSGSTLTDAMRRHPKVFGQQYMALVRAGESAGILEETLETAAVEFDKEADLREKVRSAFIYPILVLVAAVAVVVFLLAVVVPVFSRVYDQFHATLPPVTLLLVALSHVITHWWWVVVLALFGTVLVVRRFIATDTGRLWYDRTKLRLPLFGKLLRKIAIARFMRTFSAMVRAGVPILESLKNSALTAGNVVFMRAIDEVSQQVTEGTRLSGPMDRTGQFPPMVIQMIAAGEDSGNLDLMLEKLADFYARDVDYTIGRLTRMLEPLLTVVIGGVVLFVLLALYMPIFNLTRVLRR